MKKAETYKYTYEIIPVNYFHHYKTGAWHL